LRSSTGERSRTIFWQGAIRRAARFFAGFGFTAAAWLRLRDALLDHARSAPIVSVADTLFGRKYILEGPLTAPDGR